MPNEELTVQPAVAAAPVERVYNFFRKKEVETLDGKKVFINEQYGQGTRQQLVEQRDNLQKSLDLIQANIDAIDAAEAE